MDVTKIQSSKKGFSDLPGELRNQVYGYALAHNKQAEYQANLNLLRTSKAIYTEASGIFLNATTAYIAVGNHCQLKNVAADIKFSTELYCLDRWPAIEQTAKTLSKIERFNLVLLGEDDRYARRPFLYAAATSQLAGMVLRSIIPNCSALKHLRFILMEDKGAILESIMFRSWPLLLRGAPRARGPRALVAHSSMKEQTLSTMLKGWNGKAPNPTNSKYLLRHHSIFALFSTYSLAQLGWTSVILSESLWRDSEILRVPHWPARQYEETLSVGDVRVTRHDW